MPPLLSPTSPPTFTFPVTGPALKPAVTLPPLWPTSPPTFDPPSTAPALWLFRTSP